MFCHVFEDMPRKNWRKLRSQYAETFSPMKAYSLLSSIWHSPAARMWQ